MERQRFLHLRSGEVAETLWGTAYNPLLRRRGPAVLVETFSGHGLVYLPPGGGKIQITEQDVRFMERNKELRNIWRSE